MRLTPEQKLEFNNLKRTRIEQGCFLPEQEKRYNELWDINAHGVIKALNKFELIARQIEGN